MSWIWVGWVLDMEMLSCSQNRWVQKQSVNTGFVSYGYLIIQLQNILFPSTNSALSKLNLFPQGRSPPTRIHSLSPTELSPVRWKKEHPKEAMMSLWSLPPLFLSGIKDSLQISLPFSALSTPSCTSSLPAGNGFPFHSEEPQLQGTCSVLSIYP